MAAAKSNKSPAFQFYPKEFLSSSKVIAMSATERGIYITLLAMQWLDGSLPDDLVALARLVNVNAKQFQRMWPYNLARCFVVKNGRLVNTRLERERQKQAEYRRRQTDNAAKGWERRRDATASPSQRRNDALLLQSPISSLQPVGKERAPTAPIVQKRRLDAAWEGSKGLYVPQRKHSDFIGLRNHADAEKELLRWYEDVAAEWQGSPGADMFKFWTARFDEHWPAIEKPKPSTQPISQSQQAALDMASRYARRS